MSIGSVIEFLVIWFIVGGIADFGFRSLFGAVYVALSLALVIGAIVYILKNW